MPGRRLLRRHRAGILGYGFIAIAALVIAAAGYTTYTFSRYQGVILPGVYIGSLNVGDDTPAVAEEMLYQRLLAIHQIPIEFIYERHRWTPSVHELKLSYDFITTLNNAFSVGRSGSFWGNLIDRLPIRRRFDIGLATYYDKPAALRWIQTEIVARLQRPMTNAWLTMQNGRAVVQPGQNGVTVDAQAAFAEIESAMGSLSVHHVNVPVVDIAPGISNAEAAGVATRINQFLTRSPILHFGKISAPTSGAALATMLSFPPRQEAASAAIHFSIDFSALQRYVAEIATQYNVDFAPQNPNIAYDGSTVSVITPGRPGRSADLQLAGSRLMQDFKSLIPGASIKVPIHTMAPAVNRSNPASLGVTTLLGEGSTSFAGSPAVRIAGIRAIAGQLNGDLIAPGAAISFDYYANQGLAGTGWPARVYEDDEQRLNGRTLPAPGGAMQQVATTFFRAGYAGGLPVLERHPPVYHLPWYDPPGMDAVVNASGQDLRFLNSTAGYLLIETRVEPVQETLYVYIYGRATGWTVTIGRPRVEHVYTPAPPVVQSDPALASGRRRYSVYPMTGAEFAVTRQVSGPGHRMRTDTLVTRYQARRGLLLTGSIPRPPLTTPTPTIVPTATTVPPSPTPTATAVVHH